jgi:hypothetical protein
MELEDLQKAVFWNQIPMIQELVVGGLEPWNGL